MCPQNRVPAGNPTGGEFAAEPRVENEDLTIDPGTFGQISFDEPDGTVEPEPQDDGTPLTFQQPATAHAVEPADEEDPHIAAIYASISRFHAQEAVRIGYDENETAMRLGWMRLELDEMKREGLGLSPALFERKAFITGVLAYEEEMGRPLTRTRILVDGPEYIQQLKDIEKRRTVLNRRIIKGRRTRALFGELDVFEAETTGRMRALAQKMKAARKD